MMKKYFGIFFCLFLFLFPVLFSHAESTLILPQGTHSIESQAFTGDTSLGAVQLPEGLLRIESQAFAESSITQINLPSSLTFIAEDAFENCNRLEHVTVQAGTYAYTRAHEIGLFDLRAQISGSVKEALAGESITWTAKAINGVSPYKYLFEVYRNGEKIDSRAYTAEDSYTYQFTRAGEYDAIVKIKDDDGNVVSARSGIVAVTANTPVIESVNSNLSEIKTTEEVRWTVSVKKGTPPYTYAFALNQGDQVVAESENSTGEYSFIFETAGDYTLSVTVTDAYQESASCVLPFSVVLTPVSIQNISCSHESLVAETAITWTVNATAGVKPYAYSYEILSGSEVLFAAADQTANTCSYTFENAGEYTLSVAVTDAEGNTASQSVALSVASRALEIVSVDYQRTVELGNDIIWTVNAVGGDKPLRYAFDLYQDGEEIDGAAFGESNSFTFNPSAVGKYSVRIRVRDQRNTTVEMMGCETKVYIATAEEYFRYSVYSGKARITGYRGTATEVYIPATLGGYPVTSIGGSAFKDCSTLTSVIIPDGVMSIGDYAFYYCSSLTSISLPASLTSIGRNPFCGCSQLTHVEIPGFMISGNSSTGQQGTFAYYFECYSKVREIVVQEGVTSIGERAFFNCSSLRSVTIPEGVTSIGNYAFYNCSSLTSVTIPDSVTSIGYCAFYNCSSLTSVTIPEGVTSIGLSAFSGCSSLTSVTIPGSVTSIGNFAFSDCSSLRSVTIPASVTSIGGSAFSSCSSLENVYAESLENWLNIDFGNSYSNPIYYADHLYIGGELLTEAVIPAGVTSIGAYAFEYCSSLTSVTIPASVTSIGNYAFEYCSSLENVYAESLESWLNIAFSGYNSNPMYYADHLYIGDELLTEAVIPEGVTSIGNYAFYNCSSLESVTIPEGVTSIGDYAFRDCSSLKSVTIPEGVTSIGDEAFSSCSSLTSVTIPEGVTSIEYAAFSSCSSLTSVTIPEGVTSIGNCAFSSCSSLTSVTIPSSVTSIGVYAFRYCSSLTSVTIPSSVTSIGYEAFNGCSSLTSVTLQEGVTSIGDQAFYCCSSLTSVTIPGSVTSIGYYAFSNCSSLTVSCYEGSYAHTYCQKNGIKLSLITR